jgi:hypothetical protein
MRNTARVFISLFFLLSVLVSIFPAQIHAQTTGTNTDSGSSTPPSTLNYLEINADASVPRNQHTFFQAAMIESLSAFVCLLAGIDPINPSIPCLGVDPTTNKLSYNQPAQDPNASPEVGGLLGAGAGMIGYLYTPAVSGIEEARYMAQDFGIVKTVQAAPIDGFTGLEPIRALWRASRNIAFFIAMLAFLFIGFGIMLRLPIAPRVVMTLQNQIPAAIIALIFIPFSLSIMGFLSDAMWGITYTGLNVIGSARTGTLANCPADRNTITGQATRTLMQTPIGYFTSVFQERCGDAGGISNITVRVSKAIGNVVRDTMRALFIPDNANNDCGFTSKAGIAACLGNALGAFFDWVVRIAMMVIIFVAILVALFKIWWDLLKRYIRFLFYTIASPIYAIVHFMPGQPLGIGSIFRNVGATVLPFPLTAWLFEGLRVISDKYANDTGNYLVFPLIGQPNFEIGWVMVIGGILTATGIGKFVDGSLKAHKSTGAMAAGFMGTAGAIGGFAQKNWKHVNRRNPQTHAPEGIVAMARDKMSSTLPRAIPLVGGRIAARQQYKQDHHGTPAWSGKQVKDAGYDQRSVWKKRRDEKTARRDEKNEINDFGKAQASAQAQGKEFNYTMNDAGRRQWKLDNELGEKQAKYDAATTADERHQIATEMAPLLKAKEELGNSGLVKEPPKPQTPAEVAAAAAAAGKGTTLVAENGEGAEGGAEGGETRAQTVTLHADRVTIEGASLEGGAGGEGAGRSFHVADPSMSAGAVMQSMRRSELPEFDLSGHEWAGRSYREVSADPKAMAEWQKHFDERRVAGEIDESKFHAQEPPEETV